MTLFLLPNLLDLEGAHRDFLPESVDRAVGSLQGLIVESEKEGRRFLKRFLPERFREIPLKLLNEHSSTEEIQELLLPLLRGEIWGVVSDCGLPCLADPGSALVFAARQKGIKVETFAGPSSLIFALLLSGLSGQAFAFHGYLEREEELLVKKIAILEKRAQSEKSTQIFIEAPYRNQKLLERLLSILNEKTLLSVAWDLTMPTQTVVTQSVKAWKASPLPSIDKHPAIFLIFNRDSNR